MADGADDYPYDDEEPEDNSERCPECGAYPEDYHEIDCSRGDCDEDEDPADCASPNHPGCRKCEIEP